MAFIKCRKCEREIPSELENCPYCGYKVKEKKKLTLAQRAYLGLGLAVMVIALLMFYGIVSSISYDSDFDRDENIDSFISQETLSKAPHVHSYSTATCEKEPTCSCGATSGTPLGHTWVEATCVYAKKCSRCGKRNGFALGHSFDKGKCTRCDASDPNYFETLTFSGNGDKVIRNVNLPKGLYIVSLTYKGEHNFIVIPYDGDGSPKNYWAIEIGNYNYQGEVIFSGSLTNGVIEVKSSGKWTITISK